MRNSSNEKEAASLKRACLIRICARDSRRFSLDKKLLRPITMKQVNWNTKLCALSLVLNPRSAPVAQELHRSLVLDIAILAVPDYSITFDQLIYAHVETVFGFKAGLFHLFI